jgi:aminopeptidase N
VYRERQDGRAAALDFMGLHRSAIADVEQESKMDDAQKATPDRALANTSIEEFYRSKAAYVWWMLRDMLGDEALRRALEAYRPAEDTETTYMQTLLQKTSGRDLQWFFDSWLYQNRGLPDFRVASAFARRMAGANYVSTVTVENLGNAAAEVPVTVRFEGDDVTQRVLVPAKDKAVARIETPGVPIEVVVNDGSVPESDLSNNVFKIISAVP